LHKEPLASVSNNRMLLIFFFYKNLNLINKVYFHAIWWIDGHKLECRTQIH
jgi:hypothetical protein